MQLSLTERMEEQLGRLADTMSARMEKRLDSMDRATAKRRRTISAAPDSPGKSETEPEPRGRTDSAHATTEPVVSPPQKPDPPRKQPATNKRSTTAAPAYYRDDAHKKDREYVPYINNYKTPAAQCHGNTKSGDAQRTLFYETVSPRDGSEDERTEAVNNLLAVTGTTNTRARGNNILAPHRYVVRPGRTTRIGMDQASLPEYIVALCKMSKDRSLPTTWIEPVQDHIMHVAAMACTYEWPTCRQWSESVFVMIADGSLPYGWNDLYAIKDLQRDHTTAANNRQAARLGRGARAEGNADASYNNTVTTREGSSRRAERAEYSRPAYNKEANGKVCGQWNRGEDCGNSATHGNMPDRYCHICAWCANKYQKANPHQERNCQNKKRYLEMKNGEKRQTTESQDFR